MEEDFEDLDVGDDLTEGDATSPAAVVEAWREEAALALKSGDFDTAIAGYDRVIALAPELAEARLDAALAHRLAGRPREAVQYCIDLITLEPGHLGARIEMAESLRMMGRGDEAHAIHSLLVHEHPDSPATWCGLARLLAEEDHAAAAEACLRRALTLSPGDMPALVALGRLLAGLGRHDEAVEVFHHAATLAPNHIEHHVDLARSLATLGRLEEAEQRLDLALALDGDDCDAHVALAGLRMLAGRLEEAWAEADWRWQRPGRGRPELPGMVWDGSPLAEGGLLIHAEQSLSDTVRMARYLPLAAQRCGRLILWVQSDLASLVRRMDGVDVVLRGDRPVPVDLDVAAHASLVELPRLLGFPTDGMDDAPWLSAHPRKRRPVVVPPETVLTVGLAWAGRDREAGVPFALMMALAEVPGVALFSLETSLDTAATQADPSLVTDLGPTIADFADLAGRIAELDVVVAADCIAAHLAGALAKPVLLLTPADCHPRWMQDGEATPWYPSFRLIRRRRGEDWRPAADKARQILADMAAETTRRRESLRAASSGTQAAMAAFLEAHLRPGDLLVASAAGDGRVIPKRDDVETLAVEPSPRLAASLRDSFRSQPTVEVVTAALGTDGLPVLASPVTRGGRRVFPLPPGIPAHLETTSLDTLLAARPGSATRRLVLHLGQSGWEADILAGLTQRRAEIIVFEHQSASPAPDMARAAGFRLWRFPTETAMGMVVPFDGEAGAVLALAEGVEPAAHYGPAMLPPSPEEVAAARVEAEELTRQGIAAQSARDLGEAAACYARALMRDPFAPGANANKGVLMHMAGRREAAASCYRRALIRTATPGVAVNLATALRELGRLIEAERVLAQAMELAPDPAALHYDLALLRRDQGRLDEAAQLLRPLTASRPGAAWTLAQLLLARGRMAEGLALLGSRPAPRPPLPDTPRWNGEDVMARTLLIYQDCDLADGVMMARFLAPLAQRGSLLSLLCQPELAPLLTDLPGVEEVIEPDQPLPPCDFQVAMSQLPRLLLAAAGGRPSITPYLGSHGGLNPHRLVKEGALRVGLAWGGRPQGHACPLEEMLALAADPGIALLALGGDDLEADIAGAGAATLVEEPTPIPADLADTARLIHGVDVVVGGDGPELHLAAAMGKPAFVLLPDALNWRWPVNRDDSPWYANARVFRQSADGSWRPALARLAASLRVLAAARATSG